jgi:hypothetical protein
MENETPFWLVAVALPLACIFTWLWRPGADFTGLVIAGIIWLALAFRCTGRQRKVCVGGLLLLASIASVVVWAVKGRP